MGGTFDVFIVVALDWDKSPGIFSDSECLKWEVG
jgi:hypothetical protein